MGLIGKVLKTKMSLMKSLFVTLVSCLFLFSTYEPFTRSLSMIAMAIVLYFLFIKTDTITNTLLGKSFECVFSLILSITLLWGSYMDKGWDTASLSILDMCCVLIQIFALYLVNNGIVRLLCSYLHNVESNWKNKETKQGSSIIKPFLIGLFCIMLCWMIVWLAYYPGLWNYDPWQVDQVLTGNYNQQHPLLHTLLIGACYKYGLSTGNANNGVILYDLIQAPILAASFSLAFAIIRKYSQSKVLPIITLVFFCINPTHAVMAISTTKDVLFSALVLLSLLVGLLLLDENAKHKRVLYVFECILLILVGLFRTNAIICLIGLALVSLFNIRKTNWRRCFCIVLLCSGLCIGINTVLVRTLDASPVQKSEMMSSIAQQFARINERTDDHEVKQQINQYIDLERLKYDPIIADIAKARLKNDVIESKTIDVLKCSAKLLIKYKRISLDSFLYTTKGFWHIGDTSFSRVYGSGTRVGGYLQTVIFDGYGIQKNSKLPIIEQWIESLFSDNYYVKIPIISLIFSPALYIFIFLFTLLCLVKMKSKFVMCMVFFTVLGITILLGPCILIRYVYPFIVCSPVFILFVLHSISISSPKSIEQN